MKAPTITSFGELDKRSLEQLTRCAEARGIELRGAGADEAPGVYKRLPEVLDHHSGSVRILHTLTPLGVAMAGDDVVDPYKD